VAGHQKRCQNGEIRFGNRWDSVLAQLDGEVHSPEASCEMIEVFRIAESCPASQAAVAYNVADGMSAAALVRRPGLAVRCTTFTPHCCFFAPQRKHRRHRQ